MPWSKRVEQGVKSRRRLLEDAVKVLAASKSRWWFEVERKVEVEVLVVIVVVVLVVEGW